ncbi:MAG: ATP-binding protein [Methanohalobium sp.]|uniref:sensor histidine kinase n=1 Tax=Methanohalobium sp. TaxID=2837493 RepID=UPI00397C345D
MLSVYKKNNSISELFGNEKTYLKTILESQPNGIFVVDTESLSIVDTNSYTVKKTGFSEISVIGYPVSKFLILPENEEYFVDGNRKFECSIKTFNGECIPVFVTTSFMILDRRKYQIFNFVDITQIKEKMCEQQKYIRDLEESIEYKNLFADILRHDLLNPAGLVKGFTQLLLDMEKNSRKVSILEKVQHHSEKLISIIESASRLSRLESTGKLELEKMDMVPIIEQVVDDFKYQTDKNQMNVEIRADRCCPAFANDIIEDVFSNLLSNAIKYSPENSQVTIDVQDAGDFWKVSFIDSGEGINDRDKNRLFERFERVDKNNINGNGLGLAIVKKIIELHNGDIGVKDNPEGQGSIFWFTVMKA